MCCSGFKYVWTLVVLSYENEKLSIPAYKEGCIIIIEWVVWYNSSDIKLTCTILTCVLF